MLFFQGEPSDEVKEQLQRAHALHEAKLTDYHHTLQHMFSTLPQDQTSALQTLFSVLSTEETGRLASYYSGQLNVQLQNRFNLCGACGVDHEAELNESLAQLLNTNTDLTEKTPVQADDEFTSWATAVSKDVPEEDIRYVSDGQEFLPGMEDGK